MFVKEVKPSIVKNSRGEKTIQIELETHKGRFISSSPSGESIGIHEVDDYNDRGVGYSLKMLLILCKKLRHKNFIMKKIDDLKLLRAEVGKFEQRYGKLGGNVGFALESVFLKGAAKDLGKELWKFIFDSLYDGKVKMPVPMGNCIGGGAHSDGWEKQTRQKSGTRPPDFQEFLLIPKERKFSRAVTKMIRGYENARSLIKKNGKKWHIKKNDEGAWQTSLTNEEVLEILNQIGKEFKVRVGIDVAASSFCEAHGYYQYKNKELIRDRKDQIEYIERLIDKYGLFYVEDGLWQEDFSGFAELVSKLGRRARNKEVLIVGDDLTTTNLKRTRRAIDGKCINAVIIKPNQIGSLLEVKRVVNLCKKHNIVTIFSHRSGETMDTAIADLAVGFQADFVKFGINGKERLVKLRRIMEIEKKLRK